MTVILKANYITLLGGAYFWMGPNKSKESPDRYWYRTLGLGGGIWMKLTGPLPRVCQKTSRVLILVSTLYVSTFALVLNSQHVSTIH